MKNTKFLVVLGLDSEKKAHAARFDIVDEAAVRKAAGLMGFRIGRAETKEAADLATKLTEGRIFETGRGLVPFVNEAVYVKLTQKLQLEPEVTPGQQILPEVNAVPSPDLWAAIKVGSICLSRDPTPVPSWWEVDVLKISKDGKILTVRWTNSPTLKAFTVKRNAVAILPQKG